MNKSESMQGYGWRRGFKPRTKYFQWASIPLYQFRILIKVLQNVDNILDKGTEWSVSLGPNI